MNEVMESEKASQLVETARRLFMKYGIRRVTVEEICREASVSKMTFYKYFSNKLDLAKALLQKIYDDQMSEYQQIMKQDIPFSEKATHMIRMKQKATELMSPEFVREIWSYTEPEISGMLNKMLETSVQVFLKDLRQAQKAGDIRRDIKIEFILYMLNHSVEIAKDESLLKLYPTPSDLVVDITTFFFHGILTDKGKSEA